MAALSAGPAWARDEADLGVGLIASALPPAVAAPAALPATVTLILEVEVNGMGRGLLPFQLIDDQLYASRQVLLDMGLRSEVSTTAAADDLLRLDLALGNGVTYDAAAQRLAVLVDVAKLDVGTHRLNGNPQDRPVAQSATGMVLNYDVYGNYAGSRASLDGFGELRLFSGTRLLESTAVFRSQGQSRGQGRSASLQRLDTTFSWSFPSAAVTFRAGDILTRATSWSRSTRLGGVRIGTDFALQPYLVTAPIPSFFGEATLPSTVDLYIDGMKRYSGSVAPGPFELGSGGNHINGAGNAQVVVTDALGQVSTLNFLLYDTPLLLRQGLSDWSIEAGAVRRNYGLRSFSYARDPILSASYRRGLSNHLTLEAHGEAGAGLVNAGGGLTALVPFGGVVTGSLAASSNDGRFGQRAELGYSWTDSTFNLSATAQRSSSGFSDLPSLEGSAVLRSRDVVTTGYNSERFGYFGASLIRQRAAGEPRESYLGMHWQRSLGTNLSLSVSGNMGLRRGSSRGVFLTIGYTPGQRDHLSASVQSSRQRTSAALSYRRSLPTDGGTGWAVDTAYDGDSLQVASQVDHLGSHGQVTAGARLSGGRVSGYAGYSGALVAMGGDVYVARKIYDGFAVVDTSGVADVPVLLHNREVGRTNARGHMLVTGLNSYQNNRMSIRADDLPAHLTVATMDHDAVPAQGAGVTVAFAIAQSQAVLVSLVNDRGQEIPVGTTAVMAGDESQHLMVGFGGQLYIERALAGALVRLDQADARCTFRLPAVLATEQAGMLGRMTCKEEEQ